jgi:hypothetical protein
MLHFSMSLPFIAMFIWSLLFGIVLECHLSIPISISLSVTRNRVCINIVLVYVSVRMTREWGLSRLVLPTSSYFRSVLCVQHRQRRVCTAICHDAVQGVLYMRSGRHNLTDWSFIRFYIPLAFLYLLATFVGLQERTLKAF